MDRYLIIIMLVLMAYSIATLFTGTTKAASEVASGCDIVVRTTVASIFGYFISSNFAKRENSFICVEDEEIKLNAIKQCSADTANEIRSAMVINKIGFTAECETGVNVKENFNSNPPSFINNNQIPNNIEGCNRLQINIIGMLCLMTILILAYARFFSSVDAKSLAIFSQYRDLICGSIGFLIGIPSENTRTSA